MQYIVGFSGGAGSYIAAKRAVNRYGADAVTLLFCDTRTEDEDLYRFLDDAARLLGAKLVKVSDGRDIWQVFRDERMLGNNRVPLCSRKLKGEVADKWWAENAEPGACSVLGIDWTEKHRAARLQKRLPDRNFWFPLCEPPYRSKQQLIAEIAEDGIDPPRLYSVGAPHNNCGGAYVRAGHAHFRWLLFALPCVFAEWERREEEMRQLLGKDISILRDRRGGVVKTMTLRELRERLTEQPGLFADAEWGGCGCFVEV
jgi:hypothetical protein